MYKILNIKITFVFTLIICFNYCNGQNFGTLKTKEEYDLFNTEIVNGMSICSSPNESNLGDAIPYVLDGYVTMYKATKDKAYLYKFILQTLCVMNSRFSGPPGFPQYVWSQNPYVNGGIIGSLARFVYLIKVEEPSLKFELIYQFPEYSSFPFRDVRWGLYPDLAHPAYPNPTPQGFNTFYLFSDWLAYRIDQTLDYYIGTGQFDFYYGIQRNTKGDSYEINMQTGFGRAAIYQGFTDPNYSAYLPRGRNVASDFFNQINFFDNCTNNAYNQPLLRDKGNNAYWWYHRGWGSQTRDCWTTNFHQDVKDYNYYVEFVEDMSHGSLDINWAHEYYKIQQLLIWNHGENYRIFQPWQMTKFKNTFTKNLYDGTGGFNNINGTGGFNNGVDGADGVITQGSQPHSEYELISMNYMPLEEYDDNDGSSVYDIIMNYYSSKISGLVTKPADYGGLPNKGHAEVVYAQWKHECTNLELYNRNVVYNQDFFTKNKLIITPETSNLPSGISYAEPLISTKEFIVPYNVTVNMYAGESVTLKPGVQIKSGSIFRAYILPSDCTDGARMASGTGDGKSKSVDSPITNPTNETAKQVLNEIIKLRAVPNPFTSSTNIQFSLDKESKVNLKLIDNFGRVVYESKEDVICNVGFNEIVISTEDLAQGLYNCILKINNEEIKTINIVKQ